MGRGGPEGAQRPDWAGRGGGIPPARVSRVLLGLTRQPFIPANTKLLHSGSSRTWRWAWDSEAQCFRVVSCGNLGPWLRASDKSREQAAAETTERIPGSLNTPLHTHTSRPCYKRVKACKTSALLPAWGEMPWWPRPHLNPDWCFWEQLPTA